MDPFELLVVAVFLVVFSYLSYRKRALDAFGVAVAVIVGLLTFLLGGVAFFLVMVVFFVTAESCTRYARKVLKEVPERRTTGNILGNAGAALIALFLGSPIAFFGAVSTALADTVSSELGMLSLRKPRLITRLKEVEAGTDGGVTFLGLAAAVVAAAVVAVLYFFIEVPWNPAALIVITVAGFLGSLVDSVLGAEFELRGELNNTEVNFLASAAGAVIAFALGALLGVTP